MNKKLISLLLIALNLTACGQNKSSKEKEIEKPQSQISESQYQSTPPAMVQNKIVNVHHIDIAKQNKVFLLDNEIDLFEDEKIIINQKEFKIEQYFPTENGGGLSKGYLVEFSDKKLILIVLSTAPNAGGACVINAIIEISPTRQVRIIENSVDQIISNNDIFLDKTSLKIENDSLKFELYTEQAHGARNHFYYVIQDNKLSKLDEKIAEFDYIVNNQTEIPEGWYVYPFLNGMFRDDSKYNMTTLVKMAVQLKMPYVVAKPINEHEYQLTEKIQSQIFFGPFSDAETAQKQTKAFMKKIEKNQEEVFVSYELSALVYLKDNGKVFSEKVLSDDNEENQH